MNDLEELNHTGVLGMKWGVRRYQKKDGTLTELGKQRRRIDSNKQKKMSDSEAVNLYVKEHRDASKKVLDSSGQLVNAGRNISSKMDSRRKEKFKSSLDLSSMSDQDLQREINRMNLERNYKNLKAEKEYAGRQYVSNVLGNIGDVLTVGSSAVGLALAIRELKNSNGIRHSDEIQNEDYLIHYGVPGMKWGVRKDRRYNGSSGKKSKKNLRQRLSSRALSRVEKRRETYEQSKSSPIKALINVGGGLYLSKSRIDSGIKIAQTGLNMKRKARAIYDAAQKINAAGYPVPPTTKNIINGMYIAGTIAQVMGAYTTYSGIRTAQDVVVPGAMGGISGYVERKSSKQKREGNRNE